MEFSSHLIQPGTEIQINIIPKLGITSQDACDSFEPIERGCYDNKDGVNLTFLPYEHGYSYELTNCLTNELIKNVLCECECYPIYFHSILPILPEDTLSYIPSCTGKQLLCAQNLKKTYQLNDFEYNTTCSKIGNLSIPSNVKCLPSCQTQENNFQMSFVPYPQKLTFFQQKTFCHAASYVFKESCPKDKKRYFLDIKYPNLCNILEEFNDTFESHSKCQSWPESYFEDHKAENETFTNEMFEYAKENLLIIHLVTKNPQVNRIKRDVAITFIDYVANTGGLLGLFLGFSFISFIEILHWCFHCCHSR